MLGLLRAIVVTATNFISRSALWPEASWSPAAPAGVAGHCARRDVLELRVNRERQAQFVDVRHQ